MRPATGSLRRLMLGAGVGLGIAGAAAAAPASCAGLAEVQLEAACDFNSDCTFPLVCVDQVCREQCAGDVDCPQGEHCIGSGPYHVCVPAPAAGTPCQLNSDCGDAGLVCRNGTCALQCVTDVDCLLPQGPGGVCHAGICGPPGASSSTGTGGGSSSSSGSTTGTGGAGTGGATSSSSASSTSSSTGTFADAGPLGFDASSVSPTNLAMAVQAMEMDGGTLPAVTISSACDRTCLPPPVPVPEVDGGTSIDLFVMGSLTIDQTASLTLTGAKPIVIAVLGPVDVWGRLLVDAQDETPGPGAFASGPNPGPGGGVNGGTGAYANSGGSGASFCGAGGKGGAAQGSATPPSAVVPAPPSSPFPVLVGGCAGGGVGTPSQGQGGGGGGAIQISALTAITVHGGGLISACGGGGVHFGGGGGSGGAILLEAPAVTVAGMLAANGGAGALNNGSGDNGSAAAQAMGEQNPNGSVGGPGNFSGYLNGIQGGDGISTGAGSAAGGGGGAGRIQINANQANLGSNALSPALGTGCAAQGPLP